VGDAFAYFVNSGGISPFKNSVLELPHTGGLRETGMSFESWLKSRFERERKKIKKREWEEILAGPDPFSEEEERIVGARTLFNVKLSGSDEKNNVVLEIYNGSELTLKYLTVFLKGSYPRELESKCPVYVGDIAPGHVKCVPVNFYKDMVDAAFVVITEGYQPGPEDRYIFFELIGPEFFRKFLAEGKRLGSERIE
jgi:hypothetical protein